MKFTLIFVLFTYNSLFSQFLHPAVPYQKIVYAGLDHDWYETSYDSTAVTDSLDGFNQIRLPFNANTIYFDDLIIVPYFSRSPYGINGSYIECRSAIDGELIWQNKFVTDQTENIELIELMYINNENQLVVLSHKERKPFVKGDFQSYFKNMILTKRIYSIEDGKLISYFHRSYDDPAAFKTNVSAFPTSTSKIFVENGLLRYVERFSSNGSIYLRSCLLDESGAKVSKIDTLVNDDYTYAFGLVQIHPDTLLDIGVYPNSNHIYLKYLSPDLKLYYTIKSESLPSLANNISLKEVSNDKSKFLFVNHSPSNGVPALNQELIVLNNKGQLIKYGYLPYKNFDYQVLEWENKGQTFLLIDKYYDENGSELNSFLRIYKLGPDSTIYPLKSYKADNFLRNATPMKSKRLNAAKYHIQFHEGAYKDGQNLYFRDSHASAFSQMVLDFDKLGIISNVEGDIEIHSNKINVFPNPSSDLCIITFDEIFSGNISLYDNKGTQVMSTNVLKRQDVEICTKFLIYGLYYIVCRNNSSNTHIKTARLVKLD